MISIKRKTAKTILTESFKELAEKKSVDKITITDIVENCGYSTTTFYRHFRDKYDLIAWEYCQQIENILESFEQNLVSWRQTLLNMSLFFEKERKYLKNLLLHTSGYDSFVKNMQEIHYECMKKKLLELKGEQELDEKLQMYVRTYCLGTVDLSCDWILGKYNASPQEMAEVYENCLPLPLCKYICGNMIEC